MTSEVIAPAYEPATQYAVTLARPVSILGSQLLPLHEHEIRGDVLNLISQKEGADAIAAATALGV